MGTIVTSSPAAPSRMPGLPVTEREIWAFRNKYMYSVAMTIRTQSAPLVGGPLDGQTYHPVTRWPFYLSDEGKPLRALDGDRIFGRRPYRGKGPKSCYIRRNNPGQPVHYAHSSTVEKLW